MQTEGSRLVKYKGILFEKLKLLKVYGGKTWLYYMAPWWYGPYYVTITIKENLQIILRSDKYIPTSTTIPDSREFTFYYKNEDLYKDALELFQKIIEENENSYYLAIP